MADNASEQTPERIEMAARAKATAEDKGEMDFAKWFDELLQKAEALRTDIVRQ